MVNLLPLGKVHLHNALLLFGFIVTAAAKLLLFSVFLVTGRTQKAFQLPSSTRPICKFYILLPRCEQ